MDPQFTPPQSFRPLIKIRYIMAAIGVIVLAMVVGWVLGTRKGNSTIKQNTHIYTTISPPVDLSDIEIGLHLKGNKIYNNGKELFYNVKNVSDVRFGPDGKTIHFKRNTKGTPPFGERCANLIDGFELAPPDYQDPPPTQAPWDYERVNHAYTIRGCSGGGYIDDTNLFAYLQMEGSTSANLVIEDLGMSVVHTIPLDKQLVSGFFDGTESRVTSYWGETIEGTNQKRYVYPIVHSYIVNDRIILAFARLILAADLATNRLIGSLPLVEPDYNVVATSFWFETEKNIPLVVVDSGWEGVENYQALLDFSGDSLKVVKLRELDKSGFNLFKLRKVAWESDGVRITTNDEKNISEEVKDITASIKNWEDETETKAAESQAIERLKNEKGYETVTCIFSPGIIGGCFAATDIATYRYQVGGELQKL